MLVLYILVAAGFAGYIQETVPGAGFFYSLLNGFLWPVHAGQLLAKYAVLFRLL